MLYISTTDTATLLTINGTYDTALKLINNQTRQEYNIDLSIVSLNVNSRRKQISFVMSWKNTATSETPTYVEDGVNYIEVPAGEYSYHVGSVCGLMMLKDPTDPTTYNLNPTNIVYNG